MCVVYVSELGRNVVVESLHWLSPELRVYTYYSNEHPQEDEGLALKHLPPILPPSGLVLQAKLRPRNRSAEEGEPVESKPHQKESAVQRSKSCKVPGLGKPLALPPKPEKSSG